MRPGTKLFFEISTEHIIMSRFFRRFNGFLTLGLKPLCTLAAVHDKHLLKYNSFQTKKNYLKKYLLLLSKMYFLIVKDMTG